MNERVKILRDTLKLTLEKFGERIGVKKAAVSRWENGDKIADRMVLAICREFHVNEEWLRNGTGSMFIVIPSSAMEQLKKEFNLDDFSYHLVYEYLKLEPAQKTIVNNFLQSIVKEDEATCNDISSETCSVAEAEEAYIKSRSKLAKKTEQSVLNTTEDAAKTDKAVNQ